MIIQEHFLKKLRSSFDLNIYEVKIWTALLSRGIATAGELSDISNVPRSRSYDVLESLEKKGFIIMKLGKPIKYIAVKPEEIVKRVKNTIRGSANIKIQILDNVKKEKIFSELELLFKQGIEHIDPMNLTGSIKGRNNIYNQIDTMLQNAEKSVILAASSEGIIRKLDHFKQKLKRLANKGVKIRIATKITPEVKKALKDFKNIQVKNQDIGRFCIVDNKEILFMIADDKKIHENYDIAIWANTPFFANAMDQMFSMSK